MRLRPVAVLAALALWATTLTGGITSNREARADPETSDGVAATEAEAVAEAMRSNQPVQVSSLLGSRSEVRALPDGRLEQTIHTIPVRVFKGGQYVPVDTTLRKQANGDYAPVAAPVNVLFSGGGGGPFARLSQAGREMALAWPYGDLPAPSVSGDQATYPEVFPGVDLVVQVTRDGAFSHVLVVKTAEAAENPQLSRVRLEISGGNLQIEGNENGTVSAKDTGGAGPVFVSEPALMWDSGPSGQESPGPVSPSPAVGGRTSEPSESPAPADPSSAGGPGEGARIAAVKTTVGDGELALEPDQEMLTDPATRFPVYLDPRWHSPKAGWHMQVRSNDPGGRTPMTNADKGEGMGRCDNTGGPAGMAGQCGSTHVARLLFQFPVVALQYQNIIRTELSIYQTHNVSSSLTNVKLYRVKEIGEGTTWNNTNSSSFWYKWLATKASNYGAKDPSTGKYTVGPNWLVFGHASVKQAVAEAASSGAQRITFGLRAEDESTWQDWKRFRYDAQLQVLYNLPPDNAPNDSMWVTSMGGKKPCVAANEPLPRLNSKPDMLKVDSLPDPNGDIRQAEFQIGWSEGTEGFKWRLGVGSAGNPQGYLLSEPRTSPPFVRDISNLNIPANKPIRWRVRGHDFKVDDNGNPITTPPAGGHVSDMWQGTGLWSDNARWAIPEDMPHACNFIYDTAGPGEPSVNSPEYPRDQWSDEVGRLGNFKITKPVTGDVPTKYVYFFHHARATAAEKEERDLFCPDLNDCYIRNWKPMHAGLWTLQIKAVDGAGFAGQTHEYLFSVSPNVDEKSWWSMDDADEATTLADRTGTNHLTLKSTAGDLDRTLGEEGRIRMALGLNSAAGGEQTFAETSGPILVPMETYAVSAWVKLSDVDAYHVVAGQDGGRRSAFALEYDHGQGKWAMTLFENDEQVSGNIKALSREPARPGRWTHLVGVHDRANRSISLYVDGELQQTTEYASDWLKFADAGPFVIGRAKWNGNPINSFSGMIDDVHVFDAETQIDTAYVKDKLFKPTVSARWPMEQAQGSPLSTPDTEWGGQNAALVGGASISTNTELDHCSTSVVGFPDDNPVAGCLTLDGTSGHAATAAPVVRTDQDFTIAGWALPLNRMPTKTMAVFAQSGVRNSAFTVRWDHDAGGCTIDADGDGQPDQDDEGNTVQTCSGRWQIEMPDDDDAPVTRTTATSTFARRPRGDDRPDHLALVYRAPVGDLPGRMALYVNGELEEVEENTSWAEVPHAWYSPTGSFLIGATKVNGSNTQFFSGAIDDVWVYRGALDPILIGTLSDGADLATRHGEPDASYTP